ncbi:MAG: phosphotransferase [bacterium]|nr:phosphotransferase [bacterium]
MNTLSNLLDTELDESLFLQLMPEWKDVKLDISVLKGGITNKLYRIRSEKGDLALRIYGDKTELFINRDFEADAIEKMAGVGISPKLIKYIPENSVTIVEFITGSYTLNNNDFLREDLREKIVSPIRRIHDSHVILPKIFNPLVEVKKMAKILADLDVDYPEFDIANTIHCLEKLSQEINIPESEYTASHNDLLAENFILVQEGYENYYPEPMYIIDWEYAGMAPRYYDIADMFQEILVPRQVEKSFVECYCEGKECAKQLYLIDMFKPFPDIYWFLWSLIQQNISTITFDFYNYGRIKYENAQKNIQFLKDEYSITIENR